MIIVILTCEGLALLSLLKSFGSLTRLGATFRTVLLGILKLLEVLLDFGKILTVDSLFHL